MLPVLTPQIHGCNTPAVTSMVAPIPAKVHRVCTVAVVGLLENKAILLIVQVGGGELAALIVGVVPMMLSMVLFLPVGCTAAMSD